MKNIGIFFGSTTGNTEDAAKQIQKEFGEDIAQVFDASDMKISDLNNFSNIILGTSTWGAGHIQDDFEDFIDDIASVDLKEKKIALFGMGDQESHGESFVDGMAEVFAKVSKTDAEIIGNTSSEGYEHESSEAENDGKFVGLALDEDNQSELTDERIKNWVAELKTQFV